MINLENYESYLFLYQEGELDSSTCLEVERFLMEHPDIREEMETYYDPSLVVTAEPPASHKQRKGHPWQWAAAACVVLALGWGAYLILPSQHQRGATVAKATTTEMPIPAATTATNNTTEETTPAAPLPVSEPTTPRPTHPTSAAEHLESPDSPTALPAADSPAQKVEETIHTQEAEQPLTYPTLIESQQLAQVNEIIIVDNLAQEIPTQRKASEPLSLQQLARNVRKNLNDTKQNIQELLYSLATPRGSQELAEANISDQ